MGKKLQLDELGQMGQSGQNVFLPYHHRFSTFTVENANKDGPECCENETKIEGFYFKRQ